MLNYLMIQINGGNPMNELKSKENHNTETNPIETFRIDDELIGEENLNQMMKELKREADEKLEVSDDIEDVKEVQPILHSNQKETPEIGISQLNNQTSLKVLEPTESLVKKYKLFFVSDMDDEAKYLHEMSMKGLHFETKKGMQYTFKKGDTKNYFYHLSYYEKDKRDSERYLQNYEDAGWENIFHEKGEFDGIWNYFRIEAESGESDPNIFSDRVSRVALYRRLLGSWRSLLAMIVICLLFMLFICYFLGTHPTHLTAVFMPLGVIVMVIIVLTFAVYLRAYLKISKKLVELINM